MSASGHRDDTRVYLYVPALYAEFLSLVFFFFRFCSVADRGRNSFGTVRDSTTKLLRFLTRVWPYMTVHSLLQGYHGHTAVTEKYYPGYYRYTSGVVVSSISSHRYFFYNFQQECIRFWVKHLRVVLQLRLFLLVLLVFLFVLFREHFFG